jgi:CHAT domain-containing protein
MRHAKYRWLRVTGHWSLVVAVFLALSPSSPSAQTGDEAALRAVVDKMFAAFAKRDLDGVMACWSKTSPQFAAFRQFAQDDFAASADTQFADLTRTRWKIESDKATVRLRFDWKWRDAKTRQPNQQTTIWNVQFVKETDGWKWWQRSNALSDLANALQAAQTKEERTRLLRDEKELVTTVLSRFFLQTGETQAQQRNFATAFRFNDLAFEVAEALGDKSALAWCFVYRGFIFKYQSQYPDTFSKFQVNWNLLTLDNFQQALRLFEEAKDKYGESGTLINIGTVYESTRDYAEALVYYEKGLKMAQQMGYRQWEVNALNNLGMVYVFMDKYAEALERYKASLKIWQETGNKAMETVTLGKVGQIHQLANRYAEALEAYQASLMILKKTDDKVSEGKTLNNIGVVYKSMGRYAEALGAYEASLQIKREMNDRAGEAGTQINIGVIYTYMGKYAEALEKFEASLKIKREIRDRKGEAGTLNDIGIIHRSTGRYAEALAAHEASLKISKEIGDRAGEARAQTGLGNIYASMSKYAEALAAYEASLKIDREMGDKVGEATALNNIGTIYQSTGRYEESLKAHETALKISDEFGDIDTTFRCYVNIGSLHRTQKQWKQAVHAYRQAIHLIERLRSQTQEHSLQTSFFEQYTPSYYYLIECLLELGSGRDEIFAVSEQVKARTLTDILQGGKVNVLKNMTTEERQKEQTLNDNIIVCSVALSRLQSRSDAKQEAIEAAKRKLNAAYAAHEDFLRTQFIAHPTLQTHRAQFAPVTLVQLNRTLFADEPNTALLSYLIGDDEMLLFVVTRGKTAASPAALTVHRRPIKQDDLNQLVEKFRGQCAKRDNTYPSTARSLYQVLLAPAESELTGKTHVVIVPDGVLHTLPFQALMDGQGRHVIQKFAVSYAPSATALVKMMERANRLKKPDANALPLLALGRPQFGEALDDLPATERQVKVIARLFNVPPIIGKDATKAKAKAHITKARYAHFATHGLLNEAAPMYSAIALTKGANDDGRLYAREFIDMDIQTELVTLSACETALGQKVSGEGILGLTWALFVAGSPSSVVTQWTIKDESVSDLIVTFYQNLKSKAQNPKSKITKAESLRQGQLKMLQSRDYNHPRFWAAFVLWGDAR